MNGSISHLSLPQIKEKKKRRRCLTSKKKKQRTPQQTFKHFNFKAQVWASYWYQHGHTSTSFLEKHSTLISWHL